MRAMYSYVSLHPSGYRPGTGPLDSHNFLYVAAKTKMVKSSDSYNIIRSSFTCGTINSLMYIVKKCCYLLLSRFIMNKRPFQVSLLHEKHQHNNH